MKRNTILFICLSLSMLFILNSCKKEASKPIVKYSKCRILSVKILEVPEKDPNGNSWDVSDGPDVYLKINVSGSTVYNTVANTFNDNTSYPIKWSFTDPVVVEDLNVQHDFLIYDYDSQDPDDLMGGLGYIFSNSNDFPSTLTLTYQGVKLTLELNWF